MEQDSEWVTGNYRFIITIRWSLAVDNPPPTQRGAWNERPNHPLEKHNVLLNQRFQLVKAWLLHRYYVHK